MARNPKTHRRGEQYPQLVPRLTYLVTYDWSNPESTVVASGPFTQELMEGLDPFQLQGILDVELVGSNCEFYTDTPSHRGEKPGLIAVHVAQHILRITGKGPSVFGTHNVRQKFA